MLQALLTYFMTMELNQIKASIALNGELVWVVFNTKQILWE